MAVIDDLKHLPVISDLESLMVDLLPVDFDKWCSARKTPKILHDALWGTFVLNPHEVAILDTPLFQRLRFVHQTGAVSFTYPSARHTRFEHVLGVMLQASKMCQALASRPDESRFDRAFELQVRFAGLLHDIGHGPFSHTSEQYFSKDPAIAEIQSHNYYRDSGAGEVLSSLMIQTPRFREFAQFVSQFYKVKLDIDLTSNMITGNLPNEEMYVGEFVHGPFDADKLDYMHRDGMFSGLKLQIDLDRLYASIDVVRGEDKFGESFTRLAGSIAGVAPLTQIMFNKMLLFTGMYHHHKVRAVDCMLWALFELAEKNDSTIGGFKINSPINFLRLTDDAVLSPSQSNNVAIQKIINDIRNRNLWKRALVISRQTVTKSILSSKSKGNSSPLTKYINFGGNDPECIRIRREMAKKIWEKAGKPCEEHEVWLDIPSSPSMTESKRMWIVDRGIKKPLTLGEYMPIQQWVEYYGHHRWKSHVFCPPHVRDSINIAAQEVFKAELGLEFNELATAQANIDR